MVLVLEARCWVRGLGEGKGREMGRWGLGKGGVGRRSKKVEKR